MCRRSITKEIKTDTTQLRDDTTAIKNDTSEILQEITHLRAQLPDDQATLRPNTKNTDSTPARYLDDLTSYAETVCWSGEDSDTDAEQDGPKPSPKLKPVNAPNFALPLPPIPKKPSRLASTPGAFKAQTASMARSPPSHQDLAIRSRAVVPPPAIEHITTQLIRDQLRGAQSARGPSIRRG